MSTTTQQAQVSRTTAGDRWRAYRTHHQLVAKDSLMRLLKQPVGSLMTWLVIAIALALPAGLYVSLSNVEKISAGWDGAAQISLYLDHRVSQEVGEKLTEKLNQRDDITRAVYVSREQALAEFQALSDYGEVLEGLDENPLPAVIIITPVEQNNSATEVVELREELDAMVQVEQAQLDLEWVQRLYSMMTLVSQLTMALALMLSMGVLLVIGNTIRLSIENRRDEILVEKLVGATDSFVRRPFLYTGFWYGLGGGILASIFIAVSMAWLDAPVARLADLYQSDFQLLGLSFIDSVTLSLTGAMLGFMGAWIAVARHLHDIQPR